MLTLEQIPMRKDNYSYAVIKNDDVIIIDPSEPTQSIEYFNDHPKLTLRAILNTHGHDDHVAGNTILWQRFNCPVYGPQNEAERIPHCSDTLFGNEELNLLGLNIVTYDVRAHTRGHMAFLIDHPFDAVIKHGHNHLPHESPALAGYPVMFVGDSLFAAGCGKLFEGTEQNLRDVLTFYAQQDPHILMACAHEYTQSNLRFARSILPHNAAIKEREKRLSDLVETEGSTVPCLFEEEQLTNPFLLAIAEEKAFLASHFSLDGKDLSRIVGALRRAKDEY